MRNRVILLSIALVIWLGLKFIDDVVDGPEFLMLLGCGPCNYAGAQHVADARTK